jgi:hypothetical protein
MGSRPAMIWAGLRRHVGGFSRCLAIGELGVTGEVMRCPQR